jgi:hypothetical protein
MAELGTTLAVISNRSSVEIVESKKNNNKAIPIAFRGGL